MCRYLLAACVAWFAFGDGRDGRGAEKSHKDVDVRHEGRDEQSEPRRDEIAPRNLEEALAEALRANPSVLIAEARAAESRAALVQTRLAVARDVTAAYHKWEHARAKLTHVDKMQGKGYATTGAVASSTKDATERELELKSLLGAGGGLEREGHLDALQVRGSADPGGTAADRSLVPTRFREIIQKKVRLHVTDEPFADVVEHLRKETGIPFVFKGKPSDALVTLEFGDDQLTLDAALEALADQSDYCFVFREYGILVVHRDAAKRYRGAAIPRDAP